MLLACTLAAPAAASASGHEVIVRFAPGADAGERSDARQDADVDRSEALPISGMEVVDPQPGTTVAEAVAALERSPDVLYAEPNRRRVAAATPNDTAFVSQWALPKIGAPAAWDTQTGDPNLRIAVIDSGVDLDHRDLSPNLVLGWDFVDGDATPDDAYGHGTHVAGTIGARGNDLFGVTGVAWRASLIPLRVLDAQGYGDTSDLIQAYAVAAAAGAKIVNLSLGGADPSQAEYDTMRAASGVLFVVAAGNGGSDGKGDDNDYADNDKKDASYEESYPCEYNLPNVLCVAATRANDDLASFSNYGRKTVDIAAPGTSIVSDAIGGGREVDERHVDGDPARLGRRRAAALPGRVAHPVAGDDDARRQRRPGRRTAGQGRRRRPPRRRRRADTTPPDPSGQPTVLAATPQPVIVPASAIEAAPTTVTPVTAPAPAPTRTTTPSTPAADRLAPALGFSLTARGALRSALAGRLKARATCSERCSLTVDLYVDARTARSLRLSRGAVRSPAARATLSHAGQAAVTVRLTTAAKRALRTRKSLKVTVRATAADTCRQPPHARAQRHAAPLTARLRSRRARARSRSRPCASSR